MAHARRWACPYGQPHTSACYFRLSKAVLRQGRAPNMAFQRSGGIGAFLASRSRKKQYRSIRVVPSRRPLNAKPLGGSLPYQRPMLRCDRNAILLPNGLTDWSAVGMEEVV